MPLPGARFPSSREALALQKPRSASVLPLRFAIEKRGGPALSQATVMLLD
jgi:hypothetical protein